MKYKHIHRLAVVRQFPVERIVRPAVPARPRVILLFWLAAAVLPWLAILAALFLID